LQGLDLFFIGVIIIAETSVSLWSWELGNGLIWAKMWYHNARKRQLDKERQEKLAKMADQIL